MLPTLSLDGTGGCVCYHVRRTARSVTRLYDAALQPAGIRSTQFAVLVAVAKNEPVNISRLENLLGLDQTTLSRSLANLRATGHLALAAGADRRQRLARLTSKGRRTLGKALPYWRRVQRDVVSRLDDPRWSAIVPGLRAVKRASGEVLRERGLADVGEG